jgi:hypothetical protein
MRYLLNSSLWIDFVRLQPDHLAGAFMLFAAHRESEVNTETETEVFFSFQDKFTILGSLFSWGAFTATNELSSLSCIYILPVRVSHEHN